MAQTFTRKHPFWESFQRVTQSGRHVPAVILKRRPARVELIVCQLPQHHFWVRRIVFVVPQRLARLLRNNVGINHILPCGAGVGFTLTKALQKQNVRCHVREGILAE